MKAIQHRASGAPVCTVCGHDDYASLRADLDAGVRVAELAERYGVTLGSIYRHRRSGHDAVRLIVIDDADGLALADQLQLMFQRATTASEGLYAKGDLRGGSLVADHALRAASALASLGLDAESIQAEIHAAQAVRRDARRLARAVDAYLERHPEQEEALALAAESVGAFDLASDFRADPNEARDPDRETLPTS